MYLCGNQPVTAAVFRPKLGHDLREIHSTDWSEQHLITRERDPELKHKLNFSHRLPMEAKKFSKVDKDWTKIMRGLGVGRCRGAFTSFMRLVSCCGSFLCRV